MGKILKLLVSFDCASNPIFTFPDAYAFLIRTWPVDQLTWKTDLAIMRSPIYKILINPDSPSNFTDILYYMSCFDFTNFNKDNHFFHNYNNRSVLCQDELVRDLTRHVIQNIYKIWRQIWIYQYFIDWRSHNR